MRIHVSTSPTEKGGWGSGGRRGAGKGKVTGKSPEGGALREVERVARKAAHGVVARGRSHDGGRAGQTKGAD